VLSVAVVVVLAGATSQLDDDIGASVSIAFYEAVAQIVPVLLLAVMVELALRSLRGPEWRELRKGLQPQAQIWRGLTRTIFLHAALAEIAALLAIAADRSTTFLLILAAGSLSFLALLLRTLFLLRWPE
jgi:hypothetical protein